MTVSPRNGNLVILAGGISSRMKKPENVAGAVDPVLRRQAERESKSMLGVGPGKRPFLDYLLLTAERAGYRDVCIVVGERDATLRRYYDTAGAAGVPSLSLSYAVQAIPPGREKPLGTADALLTALRLKTDWRGSGFTVCNSDNLYSVQAFSLLRETAHPNALIDYDRAGLKFTEERIRQFAVLRKDRDGYLVDILEKPGDEDLRSAADPGGRVGVSMNIFRLSCDEILPYLEAMPLHPLRQEKELPLAVRSLAQARPKSVFAIPLCEHVIDLTSQSDIPAVQRYLEENFRSRGRKE